MSASPVEQRGLPEQDKLRAPGSGDSSGGTTVTFATWLRLMFQVFVLNFPKAWVFGFAKRSRYD